MAGLSGFDLAELRACWTVGSTVGWKVAQRAELTVDSKAVQWVGLKDAQMAGLMAELKADSTVGSMVDSKAAQRAVRKAERTAVQWAGQKAGQMADQTADWLAAKKVAL